MLHKHKCGDCLHIWEHERLDVSHLPQDKAESVYAEGHACPVCHNGPWYQPHFDTKADEEAWDEDISRLLIRKLFKSLETLFEA